MSFPVVPPGYRLVPDPQSMSMPSMDSFGKNQNGILPPQQVIQANGKASIDALRMSPNSSVLIMDATAPIVWLCTSDGLGNVTPVPYDITLHKEPAPVDINSLETRISNIESVLTRLEDSLNGKSDVKSAKSNKNAASDGQSQ